VGQKCGVSEEQAVESDILPGYVPVHLSGVM